MWHIAYINWSLAPIDARLGEVRKQCLLLVLTSFLYRFGYFIWYMNSHNYVIVVYIHLKANVGITTGTVEKLSRLPAVHLCQCTQSCNGCQSISVLFILPRYMTSFKSYAMAYMTIVLFIWSPPINQSWKEVKLNMELLCFEPMTGLQECFDCRSGIEVCPLFSSPPLKHRKSLRSGTRCISAQKHVYTLFYTEIDIHEKEHGVRHLHTYLTACIRNVFGFRP